MAFVVIANDSTARSPVIVSVSAESANGGPAVTGTTTIPSLGPAETEAAMVRLSIPPSDALGLLTATATGAAAAGTGNPLTVSAASFTADPINPVVNVTVSTTTSVLASVLAVCYRGGTVVGGGMVQSAQLRVGAPTTLHLAGALSDTPTTCVGFAYRAS